MVLFSFRFLLSIDLVLCNDSLLLQVLQQGSPRAPWSCCIGYCGSHLHSCNNYHPLCDADNLCIQMISEAGKTWLEDPQLRDEASIQESGGAFNVGGCKCF
ncbi:hypothetical protein ABZP36_016670 [Zizania latifolia]